MLTFRGDRDITSGFRLSGLCGLFQMVMCIPLICISNQRELVQTYQPENVQLITLDAVFSKFLLDHMIS